MAFDPVGDGKRYPFPPVARFQARSSSAIVGPSGTSWSCSRSAIFIRWAGIPGPSSAFYRVFIASLVLVPVAPMGWVYAVVAVLAGGLFIAEAHRLLRVAGRMSTGGASDRELKPMRLFHYSITYVTLLFLAVAVDPLVYLPIG